MIPKSMLRYWEEIIQRDDPTSAKIELPIMVEVVGLYWLYQIVIDAEGRDLT